MLKMHWTSEGAFRQTSILSPTIGLSLDGVQLSTSYRRRGRRKDLQDDAVQVFGHAERSMVTNVAEYLNVG